MSQRISNPFYNSPPSANSSMTPARSNSGAGFLVMTPAPNSNRKGNWNQNSRKTSSHNFQRDNYNFTPYRNNNNYNRFSPRYQGRGSNHRNRYNNRNSPYPMHNDSFNSPPAHRNSNHGLCPLSEVPIEKFISPNMLKNPWSALEMEYSNSVSFTPDKMDDSVLNSTAESECSSVLELDSIANLDRTSDTQSATEGDSSPQRMRVDNKPSLLLTPSTSEKDTGTDSDS